VAVNIFVGFFALYIAVLLLVIGFTLNSFLEKIPGSLTPMEFFDGAMFYIILGGLGLRFFMQQLNTVNLSSYQSLPVKRSTLINFLLLKSLVSPVNYLTLLVVVPFAAGSVAGYYSGIVALRFVIVFICVIWFDSFMAAFLKRMFGAHPLTYAIVPLCIAGIIALEYFRIFSLFNISRVFFGFIVLNPAGFILPAAAASGAFLLNKWFFARNYYPENFNRKLTGTRVSAADFSLLKRFGITGELITVEIKLLLRHKRTKTILYLSVFFLFYGLLFYTNHVYGAGMLFFAAMFITGILTLMYGQWAISWDSPHFDGFMTRDIPVRTYLSANYYMMVGFNMICFLLTTPYFLFGTKIIWMHIAAFLYNTGVNIFLFLFFCTYNTKRVDLSRSSAMNYQGVTFKSFLIVFPIIFFPMIAVSILSWLLSTEAALIIVSLLGIAGIIFRNQLMTLCVKQFNTRKYKLAEGFRQHE
jgi:hypothetical protein